MARQKFREAVASMRVCVQNPTEAEFRQQRLALESSYQANQRHLDSLAADFKRLVATMQACENVSFTAFTTQSNALHLAQADVDQARQILRDEVMQSIVEFYRPYEAAEAATGHGWKLKMLEEQLDAHRKLAKEPLSAAQALSIVTAQNALAEAKASLLSALNSIDQQCGKLLTQLQ